MFAILVAAIILQRLVELVVAKRNTSRLLARGAVEFGAEHYWVLVAVHVFFFCSLIAEGVVQGAELSKHWTVFLTVFIFAQLGRVWVIRSMRGRWTTRIIVLPGEALVSSGPFRFISHPNYWIVAIEIFTLPMAFSLYGTAIAASILNAIVLLTIRIPVENRALANSKSQNLTS